MDPQIFMWLQSIGIAALILGAIGALIAFCLWFEDTHGEGSAAMLFVLVGALALTSVAVHQCRGGFAKPPAEAPQVQQ